MHRNGDRIVVVKCFTNYRKKWGFIMFKKILSASLTLLMILGVFAVMPFSTSAIEVETQGIGFTSGDFEYELLDDGTASITGYSGSAAELIIPSTLDGYTVTSIGIDAFCRCTELTSITIPEGVTAIGDWAFSECSALESITVPKEVSSIGKGAFRYCSELASITIPEGVTAIEQQTFNGCTSLKSITIPKGVASIGEYAFNGCTSLESVTIPKEVASIGKCAFYGCTSLKSITIPAGVTEIGYGAFGYYVDDKIWADVKFEGFTIYGTKGTEAESYAKENDFIFVNVKDITNYLPGDVNRDGKINVKDATLIQKFVAKMIEFDADQLTLANVNLDEEVNIKDATLIQKFIADIVDSLG